MAKEKMTLQYAPWSEGGMEDQPVMSKEEIQRFAQNLKKRMESRGQQPQTNSTQPQSPDPVKVKKKK